MKRISEMSLEEQAGRIHYKYEIPFDEAKALLAKGMRYTELDKAALLHAMTGRDLSGVLALRKKNPWGRVIKALDLEPALYGRLLHRHLARRLFRFYQVPEDRAFAMLEEGFPQHWIRISWLLETHTGAPMEKILAEKTKETRWKDWASAHLSVRPEDFDRWIRETKNPYLRK